MSALTEFPPPRLEVCGVHKSYGGVRAVDDVNLTCSTGEVLAVIGPNGAGKTTLFGLISGDLRCDGGHIKVDGQGIEALTAARRTRVGLSRTFQVAQLMDRLTVRENLTLSASAAEATAMRWTRRVRNGDHASRRVTSLADRLDLSSVLGRLAGSLSQGQRKRLDIGMALVQQPNLLLFDEPTAGMGPEDVAALTQTLTEIHSDDPQLSIVFTAHDMSVVFSLASRVALMVDGHLVLSGTPDEIRGSTQAQAAYLGQRYASHSDAGGVARDAV